MRLIVYLFRPIEPSSKKIVFQVYDAFDTELGDLANFGGGSGVGNGNYSGKFNDSMDNDSDRSELEDNDKLLFEKIGKTEIILDKALT